MPVSVIIPVFNSEPHIDRCIDVLSNQTYREFEAIFVVDSRSTDGTLDRLRKLSGIPFKVKVLEQHDDKKAGGARNIGIDSAENEYIWFMDVDDTPYETFMEEMVETITAHECDVAACNFCYSHSLSEYEPPKKNYTKRKLSGYEAITALNNGMISADIWDKMFKKSFIEEKKIRFIDGCSEDYAYVLHSFLRTDDIIYYNKPLYVYYLHNNSTSRGLGDLIAERDIEIFADVAHSLKESNSPYYETFCAETLRHILHSLTNTSKDCFLKLSRSEIISESLKCRQKKFSIEVFIFKINRRLFYFIGKNARKLKYSHDRLFFDNKI